MGVCVRFPSGGQGKPWPLSKFSCDIPVREVGPWSNHPYSIRGWAIANFEIYLRQVLQTSRRTHAIRRFFGSAEVAIKK